MPVMRIQTKNTTYDPLTPLPSWSIQEVAGWVQNILRKVPITKGKLMKKRVPDETGKQKEPAEQTKTLVEEGKAELIGASYQTLQEAVGGRGELASYIALKAACAIDSQDQVKAVQIALETLDEQKPKDANGMRPCRQPAMRNGRCRLHGGKCTGAKTAGGLAKIKLVNTKHGFFSAAAIAERKCHRALVKVAKPSL